MAEAVIGDTLAEQVKCAVAAHSTWKHRLRKAIQTGECDVDVATARADDRCPFGQWLHGGIDAQHKADAQYGRVHDLHEAFHRCAAGVLDLALAGKKEEAEAGLAMGGEYTRVSAELVLAMQGWAAAGRQR